MTAQTRSPLITLGAIALGTVAFLAYLSVICGECGQHAFGFLDLVVAGVLIGRGPAS